MSFAFLLSAVCSWPWRGPYSPGCFYWALFAVGREGDRIRPDVSTERCLQLAVKGTVFARMFLLSAVCSWPWRGPYSPGCFYWALFAVGREGDRIRSDVSTERCLQLAVKGTVFARMFLLSAVCSWPWRGPYSPGCFYWVLFAVGRVGDRIRPDVSSERCLQLAVKGTVFARMFLLSAVCSWPWRGPYSLGCFYWALFAVGCEGDRIRPDVSTECCLQLAVKGTVFARMFLLSAVCSWPWRGPYSPGCFYWALFAVGREGDRIRPDVSTERCLQLAVKGTVFARMFLMSAVCSWPWRGPYSPGCFYWALFAVGREGDRIRPDVSNERCLQLAVKGTVFARMFLLSAVCSWPWRGPYSPGCFYWVLFAVGREGDRIRPDVSTELCLQLAVKGTVFARMSPEQKQQLIETLQEVGYVCWRSRCAWCVVRGAWCVVRPACCVLCGAWRVARGAWRVARGPWCAARGARHAVWCVTCAAWPGTTWGCGAWCMARGAWCVVRGVWPALPDQVPRRDVVRGAWRVVRGAWCVVRGAWSVVCGAWCVVRGASGAWCMVHGARCVVRGAWCVVCGLWSVVRGAWCAARGAVRGVWPALPDQVPRRDVARAAWCVVRDAWCMARGAWCVVRGAVWSVTCAVWPGTTSGCAETELTTAAPWRRLTPASLSRRLRRPLHLPSPPKYRTSAACRPSSGDASPCRRHDS